MNIITMITTSWLHCCCGQLSESESGRAGPAPRDFELSKGVPSLGRFDKRLLWDFDL